VLVRQATPQDSDGFVAVLAAIAQRRCAVDVAERLIYAGLKESLIAR